MESIIAQIVNFFKLGQMRVFIERFFWIFLFVLSVGTSFMFGRLTDFMEDRPAFTFISKEEEDKNFDQEKDQLFGKVSTSTIVASKTGKKYYFVWCKGAGNLKEANKIYFDTEEQAKKRGLTLANNCK